MKHLFPFICILLLMCFSVFAQDKPEPRLSLIAGAELVLPIQAAGIHGSLLYSVTDHFGVDANASYDRYTAKYESKKIATFSVGARFGLSNGIFGQFDFGYSYANLPHPPIYYDNPFRALHWGIASGVQLKNKIELGGEFAYGVYKNVSIPNIFFKIKVAYSLTLINRMDHVSR